MCESVCNVAFLSECVLKDKLQSRCALTFNYVLYNVTFFQLIELKTLGDVYTCECAGYNVTSHQSISIKNNNFSQDVLKCSISQQNYN